MTKQEAYKEMLLGFKMRHEYYSPEEFVFINSNGKFETEDGCVHGGIHDEFWSVYQKWEDGWDYYDKENILIHNYESTEIFPFRTYGRYCPQTKATKKQAYVAQLTFPVKPKSTINRNDICSCGSGLKYKKCCLK